MKGYFLSYTGKKWDGNINPALTALLDKRNVVDVPVDFTYPPDQRSLEEDPEQAAKYEQKRRSQYRYILRTIRDMVRDRLVE